MCSTAEKNGQMLILPIYAGFYYMKIYFYECVKKDILYYNNDTPLSNNCK